MNKLLFIMFSLLYSAAFGGNYLSADLDRDGRMERVVWKPYTQKAEGTYYRLEVRDDDGSLLWRGPKTKNVESPYCVAKLDFGVALPQILEDIDGDGRYELLIPEVQSDVSPTRFHRLQWEGGRFVPMSSAYLIFFRGTHNDRVQWMSRAPQPYGFWVSSLSPAPRGTARAHIIGYSRKDPSVPREGTGIVRWAPGGGAVIDWIKPLESDDTGTQMPPGWQETPPFPSDVYPGSGLESGMNDGAFYPAFPRIRYRARLSRRDHYNSRGIRLQTVAAILRQDRANFYRLGGDSDDEADGFFTSPAARERFEQARIIPVGTAWQRLRETIVNETPLVEIRYERGVFYVRLIPESYPLPSPVQSAPCYCPAEDRYIARISWRDHYNSRGRKLTTVRDILRQDRANYYHDGGDPGDRPDRTFSTPYARERIASMRLVPVGVGWPILKRRILDDTPLLEVRVSGNTLYLRLLD